MIIAVMVGLLASGMVFRYLSTESSSSDGKVISSDWLGGSSVFWLIAFTFSTPIVAVSIAAFFVLRNHGVPRILPSSTRGS
jgi:hypothetical protein